MKSSRKGIGIAHLGRTELYSALALLFLAAYQEHFRVIVSTWNEGGKWQYLVIPFVVVMAFSAIKRARGTVRAGSKKVALIVTAAGLFLTLLSRLTLITLLIELAPFFMLAALLFLLEGKRRMKFLLWPIGYCVLIIVIAPAVLPYLQAPLQRIGAVTAQAALMISGLQVQRFGNELHLPLIILDVNPWCSGINQLLSILAFSLPFAFLKLQKLNTRLLLIAVSVVISVVLNTIRIIILGFWNYGAVREHVHGPGDLFLAPIIYPAAIVLLFLSAKLIQKFDKNENESFNDVIPANNYGGTKRITVAAFILCVALVLSFIGASDDFQKPSHLILKDDMLYWNELPLTLSHRDDTSGYGYVQFDYGDSSGLALIYQFFPSQTFFNRIETDLSTSIHIVPSSHTIGLSDGREVTVSMVEYTEGDSSVLIMYWFKSGEMISGKPAAFRNSIFTRMVTERKNSASLIQVRAKTSSSLEQKLLLKNRMSEFIRENLGG
ncbi:exosortase/archaeosortase family protein [Chitinispirillales bacterium ANBcel5]|uniref:exosortase/archaeosortase family protein n=1 Tax=Cellulosispirillum alkaliphilum TaxID=3039283 RepID=UPI002A520B5B|nr:exosortase/archaeosortase family protein [Chitinispirillales bacterium ANBcel5]